MNQPLISIVILNHNGQEYIEKVVQRVLSINYPNKEIIVVDNNSQDDSILILEKFDKLKIIKNKKNYGYSRGKNIGVSQASGEYVFLIDNDILILDENILNKLLVEYQKQNNPAFICPVLLEQNKDTTIYWQNSVGITGVRRPKHVLAKRLISTEEQVYESNMIFGGNLFFLKNTWNKIGGYDEILPFNLDDYDISLRAHIMGYKSYYMINKPISTHLGSQRRNDTKYYLWNFKYLLAGHLIANVKNLSWPYFFILSFFESVRLLLEAIKQSLIRRNVKIIGIYFYSLFLFLLKLQCALRKREVIQSKRRKSDHSLWSVKIKYIF